MFNLHRSFRHFWVVCPSEKLAADSSSSAGRDRRTLSLIWSPFSPRRIGFPVSSSVTLRNSPGEHFLLMGMAMMYVEQTNFCTLFLYIIRITLTFNFEKNFHWDLLDVRRGHFLLMRYEILDVVVFDDLLHLALKFPVEKRLVYWAGSRWRHLLNSERRVIIWQIECR